MIIVILFLSFLIGIPISFALGIVSLGQIISDGYPLVVVVQKECLLEWTVLHSLLYLFSYFQED